LAREGEISYAGPGAEARAKLAGDVVRRGSRRLAVRVDLIGAVSLFADDGGRMLSDRRTGDGDDVRLRVAAAHPSGTRPSAWAVR
jgi:hypothetical protein